MNDMGRQRTRGAVNNRTLRGSRSWGFLWFALVLVVSALSGTGCTLDGDPLENRRCLNNEACWEMLGDGYACLQKSGEQGGYCMEFDLKCNNVLEGFEMGDAACDDNTYCNGDELCDPAAEGADDFGCVNVPRQVDDEIECTIDYCDEDNDTVVHDPYTNCECTGEEDERCALNYNGACVVSASCNVETLQCDVVLQPSGTECDDGIECTDGATCTNEGACVGGAPNHTSCADGVFCNGNEMCRPDLAEADGNGCVPGTPVTLDPGSDDGVACTQTFCDEAADEVIHQSTNACECQGPADCRAMNPEMACAVFMCDASTEYTCILVEDSFLPVDSPCDDGFACTANDVCGEGGTCGGVPVHTFCDPAGVGICDPSDVINRDEEGCVRPAE